MKNPSFLCLLEKKGRICGRHRQLGYVPPNISFLGGTLGVYLRFLKIVLPCISQTYSKPTSISLHASSIEAATLTVNPSFISLNSAISRSM